MANSNENSIEKQIAEMTEKLVGVACQSRDGFIVRDAHPRLGDIDGALSIGYLTTKGRVVMNEEAKRIAKSTGQFPFSGAFVAEDVSFEKMDEKDASALIKAAMEGNKAATESILKRIIEDKVQREVDKQIEEWKNREKLVGVVCHGKDGYALGVRHPTHSSGLNEIGYLTTNGNIIKTDNEAMKIALEAGQVNIGSSSKEQYWDWFSQGRRINTFGIDWERMPESDKENLLNLALEKNAETKMTMQQEEREKLVGMVCRRRDEYRFQVYHPAYSSGFSQIGYLTTAGNIITSDSDAQKIAFKERQFRRIDYSRPESAWKVIQTTDFASSQLFWAYMSADKADALMRVALDGTKNAPSNGNQENQTNTPLPSTRGLDFNSLEVGKLIRFGYELHKDGMGYSAGYAPNLVDWSGHSHSIKKVDSGAVFGHRDWDTHDKNTMVTLLGVVMGEHIDGGFKYGGAIKFSTGDGRDQMNFFALLKPKFEGEPSLGFPMLTSRAYLTHDHDNDWDKMTDEQRLNLFLPAMEVVGFKRDDILAVLSGEKTAEQAFMAVAPPEIISRRYVFRNKRRFVFDGNTAVEGNFGGINLDYFPFPFEGAATIDCEKISANALNFGENTMRHELININSENREIRNAKLKNAVIKEPIDLSQVNAKGTTFGHHTVINLDKSIASLEDIDLSLAVDRSGNRIVESDRVKIFTRISDSRGEIEVLANASDYSDTIEAIKNGAAGIGLVRTEYMFRDGDISPIYLKLFTAEGNYAETIERCAELQRIKADELLGSADGKRVVFRLIDAKIGEFATQEQLDKLDCRGKNPSDMRGAAILADYPHIVEMQAREILAVANKRAVNVDFLVPMITETHQFEDIKATIDEVAGENGFANYRVGAMIENVAMANDADVLARNADFICFGTNDLTESVTGLSRDSGAEVFETLSDEVKAVIKEGVYRAKATNPNIKIGFCGDHSSYFKNIEFYQEVGADYISCDKDFVPTAKEVFANNVVNRAKSPLAITNQCL